MALIVIAADKGAPGVTTTALALAAVWPRPVLLAECDPSGGNLVYRFPAANGSQLDPRRGLLALAVTARRGLQAGQVWEHTQKMSGGLDVLTGVINAEQGAGLGALWGPLGGLFAALPGGDVIADCGRIGPDGPHYDLLAQASVVVLVTRPNPGDVIRLRDRAAAVTAAVNARGRRGVAPAIVVIADQRTYAPRPPRSARRWRRATSRPGSWAASPRRQGRGAAARRVGRQAGQDPAHPHRPGDRAATGRQPAKSPR